MKKTIMRWVILGVYLLVSTSLWADNQFNELSKYIEKDISWAIYDVRAEQQNTKIGISYGLKEKANVSAFVSLDAGITFNPLRMVTGDVGENVQPGKNYILWDVLEEYGEFNEDRVVFMLIATKKEKNPALSYKNRVLNKFYEKQGDLGLTYLGLNASVGSGFSVGVSALRFRYKMVEICPGELVYSTSFIPALKDSINYSYQPSLNLVIPVNEKGAVFLGVGPKIAFKFNLKEKSENNSDKNSSYYPSYSYWSNSSNESSATKLEDSANDSYIWVKAEFGYRYFWGKNTYSDFFVRYDKNITLGVSVNMYGKF
jgi:hypothetical protein